MTEKTNRTIRAQRKLKHLAKEVSSCFLILIGIVHISCHLNQKWESSCYFYDFLKLSYKEIKRKFVHFNCPFHLSVSSVRFICPFHLFVSSVRFVCPFHLSVSSVHFICPFHLQISCWTFPITAEDISAFDATSTFDLSCRWRQQRRWRHRNQRRRRSCLLTQVRKTDRKTNREKDRKTDLETDRNTERKTDRRTK